MKRSAPIYLFFIAVVIVLFLAFWMFSDNALSFGENIYNIFTNSTFYILILVSLLILLVSDAISKMIESEKFKKLNETEKKEYLQLRKTPYFKWLYNDAFAKRQLEENDGVAILDHGFDGITELDNQLPRWWLGLFYFGVCCCVVYLFSFFTKLNDFARPLKELENQTIIDTTEQGIVNRLTPQVALEDVKFDASYLDKGKELFTNNCASCHKANGAGGIGPNLTDDSWINVVETELITNIAHLPWKGSKNNPTMRSFINTNELKPNDIQKIASYVWHLNQEIPNATDGAAAQGKVVKEWAKDPIPAGTGVISSATAGSGTATATTTSASKTEVKKDSVTKK